MRLAADSSARQAIVAQSSRKVPAADRYIAGPPKGSVEKGSSDVMTSP